jgi:hypothetical protein
MARRRTLVSSAARAGRLERRTSRLKVRLAQARTRAFTDGLVGGSRKWLVLGGFAWMLRLASFVFFPKPETVYRGHLRDGETLVLTQHRRPPKQR